MFPNPMSGKEPGDTPTVDFRGLSQSSQASRWRSDSRNQGVVPSRQRSQSINNLCEAFRWVLRSYVRPVFPNSVPFGGFLTVPAFQIYSLVIFSCCGKLLVSPEYFWWPSGPVLPTKTKRLGRPCQLPSLMNWLINFSWKFGKFGVSFPGEVINTYERRV